MRFVFGPNYVPFSETWFQQESRYFCVESIADNEFIFPGFFYVFKKAEKTDENNFQVKFTFKEDDLLGQKLTLLGVDNAYNLEPVYSQHFIKVDSEEQGKHLIDKFQDVRKKRVENSKRQKWFVEGKKYLYYREICGPGIFVNQMKVGQVYTNEKSYLSEIFLFGYTSEGEPQSVQYDWNNAPDWKTFFQEIE